MTESDAREQAKKEAEFYTHLATFLVAMTGLAAFNLIAQPGHLWFLYALFGWGIGIANHAAETFGLGRGSGWQQRRTQELMAQQPDEDRLRSLLDETLDARTLPAGAPQDVAKLQRRIEHLEAIVTATDDPADIVPPLPAPEAGRLDLDRLGAAPETESAERRRVRE
ncbi:MAG: 2TM domain-containing protein [Bacteroidota bacterium]